MTKFLFSLLIGVIFSNIGFAQLTGKPVLFGDLSFSQSTTSSSGLSNRSINWRATPGIGWHVSEHVAIGFIVSWGQSAFRDVLDTSVTTNSYHGGVFFRYTHFIGKSPFFIYGQLDGGYQGTYTTSGNRPSYDKGNGVYAEVYPAVGVNVKNGFCLTFSIGGLQYGNYQVIYDDQTPNITNTQFNFNFGRVVNLGIAKYFGMKKHKVDPSEEMKEDESSQEKN